MELLTSHSATLQMCVLILSFCEISLILKVILKNPYNLVKMGNPPSFS